MGDTGEKTEEATPEKLRKSKEEGQVPKSQDFVSAMGFVGGFFVLAALMGWVGDQIKDFTVASIDGALRRPNKATIALVLQDSIWLAVKLILPIAGVVFVMGVFSNVVQTGFFVAFKAVIPKFDKINPVNGAKNLFKMKKVVELLKNIVKFIVVGVIAWLVMEDALYDMTLIVTQPFESALHFSSGLVWDYMIKTSAAFIAIGVIDLIIARKQFAKEMMMSKHDIKQEYKQMEGDPEVKGKRKQLAQELLFGGGQENAKKADAVVVNPAHIAVAIKYDKDKGGAPHVVAKGMRKHAEKIKEIAKFHGIPILRNVPLAQALNKLEVGEEVPEELYEAVAEVLAFVFKIKEEQEARDRRRKPHPEKPTGVARPQVPAAAPGRGAGRLKKRDP